MYDKTSLTNHKTYLVDSLSKILPATEVILSFGHEQFIITVKSQGKRICNLGIIQNTIDWSTWESEIYAKSNTITNVCVKWLNDVIEDRYRREKCTDFVNIIRSELIEKQALD